MVTRCKAVVNRKIQKSRPLAFLGPPCSRHLVTITTVHVCAGIRDLANMSLFVCLFVFRLSYLITPVLVQGAVLISLFEIK